MINVVLDGGDGSTFEATREQTLEIFKLIRLFPNVDVREIVKGVLSNSDGEK